MTTLRIRSSFIVVALGLLAACSSSDSTGGIITDPPMGSGNQLQVDVTTSTGYVTLGTPTTIASVADPASSTAWDLAFTATPTVAVNGGASGPGDVKAYCLCANSGLTLAQVQALSATSGAASFDAVTAADIPADDQFTPDVSSQAISGWYDYNSTTHAITPSGDVWGIRLASTTGGYAKFHVVALATPSQSNAGVVTLEWAVQPSGTGALGADQQTDVDLSSGDKVYVNLSTGTTSGSAAAPWDIALEGYTISVNGGASGSGNVGAVSLVPSTFYTSYAAITSIPVGATGIPAAAFSTDGSGGAFLSSPPYRYDPVGHQVYPTFDVYLVKRGADVYKVQVMSYYSTSGVFGHLTVHFAKISE